MLAESDELKSKLIRLPYKGERVVMDILLPDRDCLAEFEAKINSVDIALMVTKQTVSTTVIVKLHNFTLEKELNLYISLKNLLVVQIVHKAIIKVYEEGTEAAEFTTRGIPIIVSDLQEHFNFISNRLFLFFP